MSGRGFEGGAHRSQIEQSAHSGHRRRRAGLPSHERRGRTKTKKKAGLASAASARRPPNARANRRYALAPVHTVTDDTLRQHTWGPNPSGCCLPPPSCVPVKRAAAASRVTPHDADALSGARRRRLPTIAASASAPGAPSALAWQPRLVATAPARVNERRRVPFATVRSLGRTVEAAAPPARAAQHAWARCLL